MGTSHLQYTAQIIGSPETIFDLIADMPNYGRWLPGSEAFGATTQVSPYPVRLITRRSCVRLEFRPLVTLRTSLVEICCPARSAHVICPRRRGDR